MESARTVESKPRAKHPQTMTIGNSLSGFRIASVGIQLRFSFKLRAGSPYLRMITNYVAGGGILGVDTNMHLAYTPPT